MTRGDYDNQKNGIYNEIFNYLSIIEIYKDDCSFPLIYPDRLKGNTVNISKKRKTFRD